MKFINTDSMAFVGPGSEWFWTAFSGLVLAVTFIAIYRQLRLQRLQMSDNTKVLRSHAHYNALKLVQRPWELLLENVGLVEIVKVGRATPDALSDIDWEMFATYELMQFDGWEYLYYQSRDGSIPTELWVGSDTAFKGLIQTQPGLTRFWLESRITFDESFRSYVDQEFARKPAPAGEPGGGVRAQG